MSDKIVRGFYYEAELNNNYIAATLHANTVPKLKEGELTFDLARDVASTSNPIDAEGYLKNPLCSAIMPEDFTFDIFNNFSQVGGDPLGNAWSNTVPTVGAYYSTGTSDKGGFKEKIDSILDSLGDVKNIAEQKLSSIISERLDPDKKENAKVLAQKVNNVVKNIGKTMLGTRENSFQNLHSAMSIQGTSYKSYTGSTITVGGNGLVMRFTIFSEFKKVGNKYMFIPCTWEVNRILPFVIGEWEPLLSDNNELKDTIDKFTGISETFINWQRPPAGFEATYKNIDTINRGTLKLRLGNFYYLDNLVIQQGSFNFSKVMAKIPFINSSKDSRDISKLAGEYKNLAEEYLISDPAKLCYTDYCPYSCDVTLSLIPVSNYSRDKLINFMQGYNSEDEKEDWELEVANEADWEEDSMMDTDTDDYTEGIS